MSYPLNLPLSGYPGVPVLAALFLSLCGLTGCQIETLSEAALKPSRTTSGQNTTSKNNDTPDAANQNDDGENTKRAGQERAAQPAADVKHKANRLAKETSPYLLMHAHNPVDWFPWGKEAFEKARRENKVVFLSVGYSSCYWCHVMERESFLDEEIAKYLNEHFVCIKVDREERPDVDDIYMMATQLISGRGGWPMSTFLTPEAKPFLGGTYFPARTGDRVGHGGFLDIIRFVKKSWSEEPQRWRNQADRVTVALADYLREQKSDEPTPPIQAMVDNAQAAIADNFDGDYGGFGIPPFAAQMPKFPNPPKLLYLIDRARRENNEQARKFLVLTLDKMAEGGIRDHLGGGFHRYSVDRFWRIPHFEKMLYDNGQLASVYAEAYNLTGHARYRRVLVELLEFVLREMTSDRGAFYSAIDAETDAQEGKFYRWESPQLASVLDEKERKLMGAVYSFAGEPNFVHEEHKFYVLQLSASSEQLATERGFDEATLDQQLAPLRNRLLAERDKRKRPLTDTKILTAWNGLMIRGFADAGRILKEDRYIKVASRAAEFILDELQTDSGRLLRTHRDGTAKLNAYLVDYAFLVDGLIALHRATDDPRWLDAARKLTDKQVELFWDEQSGGFFYTSDDHETLIARAKKRTDNVVPSGNGIAATNLVYLTAALPKQHYRDYAEKTLGILAEGLNDKRQAGQMPTTAVATAAWLDLQD